MKLMEFEDKLRQMYLANENVTQEFVEEVLDLMNNITAFTSNVLNVVSNKQYEIDCELISLKGMDRLVKLNEKDVVDTIQKQIDDLPRNF